MKKMSLAIVAFVVLLLSGCTAYYPYNSYYQPGPVVIQSRPVYIQPSPVYIQSYPRCAWVRKWDHYYRTYRNVRVCR